jgi:hypothetical protein
LKAIYWLLCSHTHCGYLSVDQSRLVTGLPEQQSMMRMCLQTGLTVMAGFVFDFADLFDKARCVLESNELGMRIAQNYRHSVEEWKSIIPESG